MEWLASFKRPWIWLELEIFVFAVWELVSLRWFKRAAEQANSTATVIDQTQER